MAQFFRIGNNLINEDQIAWIDFDFTARGHSSGMAACIYFAFAATGLDTTGEEEGGPYMKIIANGPDLASLKKHFHPETYTT
jgi:hypothetical protein